MIFVAWETHGVARFIHSVCDVVKQEAHGFEIHSNPANHGAMLLTEVKNRYGQHRVYYTRLNSVVAFFEEDGDGNLVACVEPGDFACPWSMTQEKLDAVKFHMIEEVAARLQVRPDQVECMNFIDILNICDPAIVARPHVDMPRKQARGDR